MQHFARLLPVCLLAFAAAGVMAADPPGTVRVEVIYDQQPLGAAIDDIQAAPDGDALLLARFPSTLAIVKVRQDGRRDAAFGVGGVLTLRDSMGIQENWPNQRHLVTLADGSWLVWCNNAVLHFHPDGSPDRSYALQGTLPFDHTGYWPHFSQVSATTDGQCAMWTHDIDGEGMPGMQRWTATGQLDPAFPPVPFSSQTPENPFFSLLPSGAMILGKGSQRRLPNGTTDTAFIPLGWSAALLAARADDGYLAAGVDGTDLRIARCLANGTRDPAWHGGANLRTPLHGTPSWWRIDQEAVGTTVWYAKNRAVRITPSGDLDLGFGTGGTWEGPTGAVAVGSVSGALFVAGGFTVASTGVETATVVRYGSNGSGDPVFAGDGRMELVGQGGAGISSMGGSVGMQSDGRIAAISLFNNSPLGDDAFWYDSQSRLVWYKSRFLADGQSPDPTFGSGGALAILPDTPRDAYFAGFRAGNEQGFLYRHDQNHYRRYTLDGQPDPTFASGQDLIIDLIDIWGLRDGGYLYAGPDGWSPQWVTRLQADGSLDRSFGNRGSVTVARYDTPWLFGEQPDGGLLVVSEDGKMLRLTPDGRRDMSFGDRGAFRIGEMSLQPTPPDGGFIGTRSLFNQQGQLTALAIDRFDTNGTRVSGFTGRFPPASSPIPGDKPIYDDMYSGIISLVSDQNHGFAIERGYRWNTITTRSVVLFWLIHLTPDGQPDTTFGDQGRILLERWTDDPTLPYEWRSLTWTTGWRITVQDDGRPLLTRGNNLGIPKGIHALRLTTDGRPDLSFGPDGYWTSDGLDGLDGVNAVAGRLVFSGRRDGHLAAVIIPQTDPANHLPTIAGQPVEEIAVGSSFSFAPVASDADGDALTFAIANRPAWASFDAATGTLSGTPPAPGTFTAMAITVTDTHGTSARLGPFELRAVQPGNVPPVVTALDSLLVEVGATVTASTLASDNDTPLVFGLRGAPSWVAIHPASGGLTISVPAGTATGAIAGIEVTVTDAGGARSSRPLPLTITDTIAPALTIGTTTRASLVVRLSGTAVDAGGVATVAWTNLASGAHGVAERNGGTWISERLRLSPGTTPFTITATDRSGNLTSASVTLAYAVPVPWVASATTATVAELGLSGRIMRLGGSLTSASAPPFTSGPYKPQTDPEDRVFEFVGDNEIPEAGRGYFLTAGTTPPLAAGSLTEVPLAIGWNLLGAPEDLPWDRLLVRHGDQVLTLNEARTAGLLGEVLWVFDPAGGGWHLLADPVRDLHPSQPYQAIIGTVPQGQVFLLRTGQDGVVLAVAPAPGVGDG